MQIVYKRCCGMDVHKDSVTACLLLIDAEGEFLVEKRRFGTMTRDLKEMRAWLKSQGVERIAMEATGVYWKPVWNILEAEDGFELLLVNAQHVKNVPGRKTDQKDSEWLADLLQHGLLRGSFVPPLEIRQLRDLTRMRTKVRQEVATWSNRIQKVLEDANIKLGSVASDVLGVSGRQMLKALMAGQQDPRQLAELARGRLKEKVEALQLALEGHFTEHHGFQLQILFDLVEYGESQLEKLATEIRRLIMKVEQEPFGAAEPKPEPMALESAQPKPSPPASPETAETAPVPEKSRLQNAMDLWTTIPGISEITANMLVAEIGVDMNQFPSAHHLASWAGLCPGNNESAGKRRSGKTRKGSVWLRRTLCQAAWAASRTKNTYLSAQYRRLIVRKGKKKTIVAVAHSMLTIAYAILKSGKPYRDLGADYFDRLNSQGLQKRLVNKLTNLGFEVTLTPKSEPA
jgi:transposase